MIPQRDEWTLETSVQMQIIHQNFQSLIELHLNQCQGLLKKMLVLVIGMFMGALVYIYMYYVYFTRRGQRNYVEVSKIC